MSSSKVDGFTGMYREIMGIPPAISHDIARSEMETCAKREGMTLATWADKYTFPRILLGLPKDLQSIDAGMMHMKAWSRWRIEVAREFIAFGAYLNNAKPTRDGLLKPGDSAAVIKFLDVLAFHLQRLREERVRSHFPGAAVSAAHYTTTMDRLLRMASQSSMWHEGLLPRGGLYIFKHILEDARDPVKYMRWLAGQRPSTVYDAELIRLSLRDSSYAHTIIHMLADIADMKPGGDVSDPRLIFQWDGNRRVIMVSSGDQSLIETIKGDADAAYKLRKSNRDWWLEGSRVIIPTAPLHGHRTWEYLTHELKKRIDSLMPLIVKLAKQGSLDAADHSELVQGTRWIARLERDAEWSREMFERISFNILWRATNGEELSGSDDRVLKFSLEWLADRIERARTGSSKIDEVWERNVGTHLSVLALRRAANERGRIDDEMMQGLKWFAERAIRSRGLFNHLFHRSRLEGTPEGVVVRGLIERFKNILVPLHGFIEAVHEFEAVGDRDVAQMEIFRRTMLRRAKTALQSEYRRCWDPFRRLEEASFDPYVNLTVDVPTREVSILNEEEVNAVVDRVILCAAYLPGMTSLHLKWDAVRCEPVLYNEDGHLMQFLADTMYSSNHHVSPQITEDLKRYAVKKRRIYVNAIDRTIYVPVLRGSRRTSIGAFRMLGEPLLVRPAMGRW